MPGKSPHRRAKIKECVRRYRRTPKGRAKEQAACKARRQRIREAVILALGGKCECCGEPRWEFLTLDHRNNDGAEHRRRVGKPNVYASVLAEGCPKEKYRVLCFNCNCAIGRLGYCPHERERRVQLG